MVIVDEAWGGHLHFHDDLPSSAMEAGADVAVQSTHKLAGGLQQTGLIHWREQRVDSELMEEAYREYVTTSPSYHLLASADAAVRTLVAQGERGARDRDRAHPRAEGRAARAAPRPRACSTTRRGSTRMTDHVAGTDLVKTTVGLARYELSGYDVAQALVERGIVIEKAGVNTLTLITTFQLAADGGARTRSRRCVDILGAARAARRRRAAARRPTRSARSTTGR